MLILGKLIEVFEVHGLINNQQTGDAMSRPHAKLSIQDNTKSTLHSFGLEATNVVGGHRLEREGGRAWEK